jgi:acyl-CoA thioester hydrolase
MRKRGAFGVETILRVPFFDVDSMNVVWHGHYVKYLEEARCALLDAMDYGYDAMRASGYVWPVIDMQLRYMNPAVFGQRIVARAELVEWENRLKIHYLLTDEATGTRLTRASTIQVAVSIATREMQLASPEPLLAAVRKSTPYSLREPPQGGDAGGPAGEPTPYSLREPPQGGDTGGPEGEPTPYSLREPPQGGDTGGPAKPDPRCPRLGDTGFLHRGGLK